MDRHIAASSQHVMNLSLDAQPLLVPAGTATYLRGRLCSGEEVTGLPVRHASAQLQVTFTPLPPRWHLPCHAWPAGRTSLHSACHCCGRPIPQFRQLCGVYRLLKLPDRTGRSASPKSTALHSTQANWTVQRALLMSGRYPHVLSASVFEGAACDAAGRPRLPVQAMLACLEF